MTTALVVEIAEVKRDTNSSAATASEVPVDDTMVSADGTVTGESADEMENSFKYVISDALGIHARPAEKLVKLAKELDSTITVAKAGGGSAKATRPMALMGLSVKGGDKVIVIVEGGNASGNLQAMKQFFKENL